MDRYRDYYNGWTEQDENDLWEAVAALSGRFLLSTWHHNEFRKNVRLNKTRFPILTREHFYHLGASEKNRHPMTEALVTNIALKDNGAFSGRVGEIRSAERMDLFAI